MKSKGKSQNQFHHKREIKPNGDLHIPIFTAVIEQEFQTQRQYQEITEQTAKREKQGPKENKQHGDLFLFDLETGPYELPEMVQNQGHRYKYRTHQRHFHVGEKRLGGRDINKIRILFGKRIFQPEQENFNKIKRKAEKERHHYGHPDEAVLQLYQMVGNGYLFSKLYFSYH